jgi:hypothetical protein
LSKVTNDWPQKLSLVIEEKNKLIKEKDQIISTLYARIQQNESLPQTTTPQQEITEQNTPIYHHRDTFINVND